MIVYYKRNGRDAEINDVEWVDIFMLSNGTNTAMIHKGNKTTEIPLQDLVSMVDRRQKIETGIKNYKRDMR